MGKTIIVVGLIIVLIGLIYTYFPAAITWFGNLPGDIKVKNENSSFYFPITSMIVISILFSLAMRVFRNLGG